MAKNAWMPRGFSLGYEKKRIKCLHSFVEVMMHVIVNCNWWYICQPLENPCHVSGQYTRRRRYIHVDRFTQYLVLSKFHSLLYQMMLLYLPAWNMSLHIDIDGNLVPITTPARWPKSWEAHTCRCCRRWRHRASTWPRPATRRSRPRPRSAAAAVQRGL